MNEVQPIKNKRDIQRMKKALHGRDLLLFTIGINTALRISDLLKLRAEDFSGEYIVLKEQKTGKAKRIKINEAVRKSIRELAPSSGYLFPSRKGDAAIGRVQAYRILNAAADRAGINTEIGTHTLRKTFAYHAYKSGVDIAVLMTVLNHASQRDTLKYIGIVQDTVDDVYIDVCL
ncbi:tyrosine-type recombinase/integrase [Peribacillus huizhouensis]|uniref:Integrase n=1 Tax=Peribacillus huizhouensis TaxID=1501239 RepID=A0ABR6CR68_9BACI|nr:tyrosine-type recombinase/integrase [Peribacillus huizhouensis]MBA9027532.1 integrase [Peribacillus huizhouensis]